MEDTTAPPTGMCRLAQDLIDMASAIYLHERVSCAELLDPIVRPELTRRYGLLPPEIHAVIELRRARRGQQQPTPA